MTGRRAKTAATLVCICAALLFAACGDSGGGGGNNDQDATTGPDGGGNGEVPVIGGCEIFPPDNPWNTDISQEPVDPDSDAIIADIGLTSKGMRVRLRADFDVSTFPQEVQVILNALKKHGMFVADNGSDWFISGAPDMRWDDDALHTFHQIEGQNFEVIQMGRIYTPADFP